MHLWRPAVAAQSPSRPTLPARRVAHQVAVALLDHIAKMDANAELDAVLALQAGITFQPCRSVPRWHRHRARRSNWNPDLVIVDGLAATEKSILKVSFCDFVERAIEDEGG